MIYLLPYFAALVATCTAVNYGYITNFRVTSSGDGSITLAWDFVAGDPSYPLHKYSLSIDDDDLVTQFKCTDPSCSRQVEFLDACVKHNFELTPIFESLNGSDVDGTPVTTSGYTTDEVPGAASNLIVVSDNDVGTTLRWRAPLINPKCVEEYEVCAELNGKNDLRSCDTSNATEITLVGLEACGTYTITITPFTPSGLKGDILEEEIKTHDGVPGSPQNVEVGLITQQTIQLLWDDPIVNALCWVRYVITIGETHTLTASQTTSVRSGRIGQENEFTFTPLFPCTDYTIAIASANAADLTSDYVTKHAATNDAKPDPPSSITVGSNGETDSIDVSWDKNENDRCSGNFTICWNDGVNPTEQCKDIGENDDDDTIIGLLPCSHYTISIVVNSPNGSLTSDPVSDTTSTGDVAPSAVVDLKTTAISSQQIEISFKPPANYSQCVKEYDIIIIDEDQNLKRYQQPTPYLQDTFTGLMPCTHYRIQVTAVTPSGLRSPMEEITALTTGEAPSVPQALDTSRKTETSITLTWYQPNTNPRCVDSFYLVWEVAPGVNTSKTITSSEFKVTHTVGSLKACKSYTFTVLAKSAYGDSPSAKHDSSTVC